MRVRHARARWPELLAAFALLAGTACNIDPYHLGGSDADIQIPDAREHDGGGDFDTGGPPDARYDAGPDACIAEPEQCDNIDHDCDGDPMNGFNLQDDPANCGTCGNKCQRIGASGVCDTGECVYECLANRWDQNGDLEDELGDGCEYVCQKSADEDVPCNFRDDDCDCPYEDTNSDGVICGPGDTNVDEGSSFDDDVFNCGGCFNVCTAAHATPTCIGGECGYENCDPNFENVDLDDEPTDIIGCEYECPNPDRPQETCNGIDDNCNGEIDELPIAGLGDDCYPDTLDGCEVGVGCEGICSFGTTMCAFGVEICSGWSGPDALEQCDAEDHDCDGQAYNGFNIDSDPNHCGPTCAVCSYDHAIAECTSGTCGFTTCLPGWADGNNDRLDPATDGCEYFCTKTSDDEVCDGKDNNCNYEIDEGVVPPGILTCSGEGQCGVPTTPTPTCYECGGVTTWRCDYRSHPGVHVDSCGQPALFEERCDNLDNDCDKEVDEDFPQKGLDCSSGLGVCKNVAEYQCDPADDSQVYCKEITPGGSETPEKCNNLDDDCDDLVDSADPDYTSNPLRDTVIYVPGGTLSDGVTVVAPFIMDAYEASRPDAASGNAGSVERQACSNAGVEPWRNISRADAEAACEHAGKRLCTEAEWQMACEGPAGYAYPYSNTYVADACGGWDYGLQCESGSNRWRIHDTEYNYTACDGGTSAVCVAEQDNGDPTYTDVYDLSGNAQEWTSTLVESRMVDDVLTDFYRVRGGSYLTQPGGLTCQHDFISFADATKFPTVGFRCCQDATP